MYENWKIKRELIDYNGDDEELKKESFKALNEYSNVSNWCNKNNEYTITHNSEYYYTIKIPEPSEKEKLQTEYYQLQENLKNTDYITNKLAEVVDDIDAYREMKEHYSEQLSQRQFWRQRIREIENELKDL